MTDREAAFVATIPAGTSPNAPVATDMPWDDGVLIKLHVTIPDGHAGLTGYQFAYDGQQMIPNNTGAFITSNDEKIEHDVSVVMVGGRWSLVGYNRDVYDHSFYIRAEINELPQPAAAPQVPLSTISAVTPAQTAEVLPTLDEALAIASPAISSDAGQAVTS